MWATHDQDSKNSSDEHPSFKRTIDNFRDSEFEIEWGERNYLPQSQTVMTIGRIAIKWWPTVVIGQKTLGKWPSGSGNWPDSGQQQPSGGRTVE